MKYLFILMTGVLLAGCSTPLAYTKAVESEFDLSSVNNIKKVQFRISTTIKLIRSSSSGNQGTNDDGTLISNSSKDEEIVTIPFGTFGMFEAYGENGEIIVRFEEGSGRTLTFNTRPGQPNGKYFIVADWKADPSKGGKIEYSGQTYHIERSGGSGAHLIVMKKKLHKTNRKERVVKGLKV